MKHVLVFNIQNLSDIITNSSSEVFIVNSGDDLETVKSILAEITEGYDEPYICDNNTIEKLKSYELCFDDECEYTLSQLRYYNSEFNKVLNHNKEYIDSSNLIKNYHNYNELSSLNQLYKNHNEIMLKICKEFCNNIPKKIPEYKKPEYFLGKVIIESECDNTIPYDDFDEIESIFNANRYHLG